MPLDDRRTALVTGASSFASDFSLPMRLRRMARPLVITAHVRLSSTPSRRAHHSMSLFASAQGISSNLMRRRKSSTNCKAQGVEVDILVDNAGHGFHGKWWELQCNTESAGGYPFTALAAPDPSIRYSEHDCRMGLSRMQR